MIDDWLLSMIYAAWLAASTMPLGFMIGSSCSQCCGGCGVADGKPREDPTDGVWFFYGSSTTSKPGGSASTSEQQDWANICNWYSNKTTAPGSYSNLVTTLNKRALSLPPSNAVVHIYTTVTTTNSGPVTVKQAFFRQSSKFTGGSELTATEAPQGTDFLDNSQNDGSTINGGARFVSSGTKNINHAVVNGGATFSGASVNDDSTVNGGATFSGTSKNQNGAVVNDGASFSNSAQNFESVVNGGATFNGLSSNGFFNAVLAISYSGTVNDGAIFNDSSENDGEGVVNGGAVFNDLATNRFAACIVNDGAEFNDEAINNGEINGGATFNSLSANLGDVNGGAVFNNDSYNWDVVNDGAIFNDSSKNGRSAVSGFVPGTVNDGATFNDTAENDSGFFSPSTVNGGAVFNGNSVNRGIVNGGATFNDAACSRRTTGNFAATPCTRKFVAHPTDLPTCNGTAPDGCANAADTCGCG